MSCLQVCYKMYFTIKMQCWYIFYKNVLLDILHQKNIVDIYFFFLLQKYVVGIFYWSFCFKMYYLSFCFQNLYFLLVMWLKNVLLIFFDCHFASKIYCWYFLQVAQLKNELLILFPGHFPSKYNTGHFSLGILLKNVLYVFLLIILLKSLLLIFYLRVLLLQKSTDIFCWLFCIKIQCWHFLLFILSQKCIDSIFAGHFD